MIPFNKPPYVGCEQDYMLKAIKNNKISGDGEFTKKCQDWLEEYTHAAKILLTTSCTSALEMSSLICGIEPGDEIIMPSYTFVSTANAFVIHGAKIVFVDIRPDTMNIDEKLIEDAITDKTKAIVPVHYAGVGCDMDVINDVAKRHNLFVIEDAAQGMHATYKGKALGTIGDFGAYSYHETKNYSMGEGGAILLNNADYLGHAEIIREKGTNRNQFFRGQVDKYTWVDKGSSFLPSELNAAYLWAQLERADEINDNRMKSWKMYREGLIDLEQKGYISLPIIPKECKHNAHMFYIKVDNLDVRTKLLAYLKEHDILAVFHYVPLHSSEAGIKYGRFHGEDKYTTSESERLLRLPMYYGLKEEEITYIIDCVHHFFEK
ncbi:MAG: dTDP-4-amino-4,6-dideoxygalactose transaminase [Lachnospiraceae bacterium]|jgi:dTDP-4-amino-4,6-dideoxygalactose transaminase|nr:dTDP-4-amino-4,6-dideoxygalactose transaminase [Lachnospiraceae bacterium]